MFSHLLMDYWSSWMVHSIVIISSILNYGILSVIQGSNLINSRVHNIISSIIQIVFLCWALKGQLLSNSFKGVNICSSVILNLRKLSINHCFMKFFILMSPLCSAVNRIDIIWMCYSIFTYTENSHNFSCLSHHYINGTTWIRPMIKLQYAPKAI